MVELGLNSETWPSILNCDVGNKDNSRLAMHGNNMVQLYNSVSTLYKESSSVLNKRI